MTDTQRSITISTKQGRIAEIAKRNPGTALTTLAHHMELEWMREAHRQTRKDGATGVDGQTAEEFEANLEANLLELLNAAKSGTYRALPVRRVHIPKGDGSTTRPIGIPTYADKVLQRAVKMLLEPIYEQDFYDFSYGFRPNLSAHDALGSLMKQLWGMYDGGWVLDVDIRGFFDNLDHEKLRDLLSERVTDGVVSRLVGKWLRAGVMEGGVVSRADLGTPQGGVISPLLANIYLHTAVDRWWVEDVLPHLRGRAFLIRYADDFVMVFSSREDALRVQEVLPKRLMRFGLTLHPEKTKLVEFRRPVDGDAGGEPRSFDFLGFTHYWGRSRKGNWAQMRKTSKSRFSRSLRAMNAWMRSVRHWKVVEQAKILASKLRGHFNYYGLAGNSAGISRYHHEVTRLWLKWLSRRSQKGRLNWAAFNRRILARYPLPPPRLAPNRRWPTGNANP